LPQRSEVAYSPGVCEKGRRNIVIRTQSHDKGGGEKEGLPNRTLGVGRFEEGKKRGKGRLFSLIRRRGASVSKEEKKGGGKKKRDSFFNTDEEERRGPPLGGKRGEEERFRIFSRWERNWLEPPLNFICKEGGEEKGAQSIIFHHGRQIRKGRTRRCPLV